MFEDAQSNCPSSNNIEHGKKILNKFCENFERSRSFFENCASFWIQILKVKSWMESKGSFLAFCQKKPSLFFVIHSTYACYFCYILIGILAQLTAVTLLYPTNIRWVIEFLTLNWLDFITKMNMYYPQSIFCIFGVETGPGDWNS